jgi:class 3 adenylate cyclase
VPDIRFAPSGEVSVAYDVVGDGPIDIVYVQGAETHLEVNWELPAFRAFCLRLGEFSRLIRFDKRGMGMSDRVPGATTLETRMDDIRAVMDAVGSERAAIIGESEGGPLSMLFAAAHPERTIALVLQGAEVRERKDEGWPWGEETTEEFEARVARLPGVWGTGTRFERRIPSVGDATWAREWASRLQMNAGTPGAMEAFIRMAFDIDVRDIAPAVNVPTLIIHSDEDTIVHVENGRLLARVIPGARYLELHSRDHLPWFEIADQVVGEIREFLTGQREPMVPDRVLATVLFTDIVGSTATAAELGDQRWRQMLESHHAIVRRALASHRGVEIDTSGDGFFATFDGPARAIRCAQAIQRDVVSLGIKVRAGVHTGEIERIGDGVAGIAVHIGARVAAAAGPGEVWVSGTVRDLVAGSGLEFEDRGTRELKGVPGEWRLYSVS